MAEPDAEVGNGNIMHSVERPTLEAHRQQMTGELFSPTHVLSPASSLDSEESLILSDEAQSSRVDLSPSQEDQIEKLKEFLSEAQVRGDDYVTQSDADTVKGLENMQIGTSTEVGLGARLESAARANLEIEKQTAAGYFPSETVYLQEHTLKEVLDESNPVLAVTISATVANHSSPKSTASPSKSPRSVDADNALKNELDCLFEERASRFRLE